MTPSQRHAQSRCERLAHPGRPVTAIRDEHGPWWPLNRALKQRLAERNRTTSAIPPSAPFGHGIGE